MKSGAEVMFFDKIASTNSEAKRMAESGHPLPFVIAADSQTSGRGRCGRSFFSPAGSGIYMSVAVSVDKALTDAVFLTSAAAVSVCNAIDKVAKIRTGIKWVNDIYAFDKKIAGILTESVTDGKTVRCAVIGVGINVTTTEFPPDISERAGSVGFDISRCELCAAVADSIIDLPLRLCDRSFLDEYRQRSVVIGKEITYTENGISYRGYALGIDDFGGLIVKTENGKRVLTSGEISVEFRI